MRYSLREPDPVFEALEPVIRGLGMSLVELVISRRRVGGVKSGPSKRRLSGGKPKQSPPWAQIRVVVYKAGPVGLDDCAKVHEAILPRLALAFPGEGLEVEVSSPGIDRLIKDGSEFFHYIGRGIRCYRIDTLEWIGGVLQSAAPEGFIMETQEGPLALSYAMIGKAKLDHAQEVYARGNRYVGSDSPIDTG